MSNVFFGTATEKDVRNQQVGVDKAIQIGNINARELKYLGNALKKAMVIHKENMGFNLEAVMANTGAVQNISMAFGLYTVRKHIEEQLLSSTRKLQLILLQLDIQFQLLISDVIALTNGVLRPTLVTDVALHGNSQRSFKFAYPRFRKCFSLYGFTQLPP